MGCPAKNTIPILEEQIYGSSAGDFNVSLQEFLAQLPQQDHEPVVHALMFLASGEMSPDFYVGKTIRDFGSLALGDVFRFEVYGLNREDIIVMAQKRFNRRRTELQKELDQVQEEHRLVQEQIDKIKSAKEMLKGFVVRELDVRFDKGPLKVLAYLDFRVENFTTQNIKGFNFQVQFLDKADRAIGSPNEKKIFFDEGLNPGQARSFRLLASNGPSLQQITFSNYAEHFKVTIEVVNAYLEGGRAIAAILPNLRQEKKIQELEKKKLEVAKVLDQSSHSSRYSFWSGLH